MSARCLERLSLLMSEPSRPLPSPSSQSHPLFCARHPSQTLGLTPLCVLSSSHLPSHKFLDRYVRPEQLSARNGSAVGKLIRQWKSGRSIGMGSPRGQSASLNNISKREG